LTRCFLDDGLKTRGLTSVRNSVIWRTPQPCPVRPRGIDFWPRQHGATDGSQFIANACRLYDRRNRGLLRA